MIDPYQEGRMIISSGDLFDRLTVAGCVGIVLWVTVAAIRCRRAAGAGTAQTEREVRS